MSTDLELFTITRTNIKDATADLNIEQWNMIPEGFHNNVIWNVGHVVATTELLIYGLAGIDERLDDDLIKRYRKGTAPKGMVDEAEITAIGEKLSAQVKLLEEDLKDGLFTGTSFKKYPTSYGYTLTNVHEAIQFNNVHESLHLGYIMAMKHSI